MAGSTGLYVDFSAFISLCCACLWKRDNHVGRYEYCCKAVPSEPEHMGSCFIVICQTKLASSCGRLTAFSFCMASIRRSITQINFIETTKYAVGAGKKKNGYYDMLLLVVRLAGQRSQGK
jgi:hypothetical protein